MTHEFITDSGTFEAKTFTRSEPKETDLGVQVQYIFDEPISDTNKYKFIGIYPHFFTEQMAHNLVDFWLYAGNGIGKHQYKNYNFTSLVKPFDTALESFATLMESEKLYLVNPYEKPIIKESIYKGGVSPCKLVTKDRISLKKWQEAKSRTSSEWAILELINK
jgi:hypothetical protein